MISKDWILKKCQADRERLKIFQPLFKSHKQTSCCFKETRHIADQYGPLSDYITITAWSFKKERYWTVTTNNGTVRRYWFEVISILSNRNECKKCEKAQTLQLFLRTVSFVDTIIYRGFFSFLLFMIQQFFGYFFQ